MPTLSPAQVTAALRRAGYNRTASAQDITNASRYGLAIFGRNRAQAARPATAFAPVDSVPPTPTAEDISRQFIEQVRPLFNRQDRPEVTPFEQSGFYSEADVRSLANREYDPAFQRERAFQGEQDAESERQRLEEVNAAGGTRSSAFDRERGLRQQALQRALAGEQDQLRARKEQFTLNRRNEAYQRYLQSIGAVT